MELLQVKDTGLYDDGSSFEFFFQSGITVACFHALGKVAVEMDLLYKSVSDAANSFGATLRIQLEIPSGPDDLPFFACLMASTTSF